MQSPGWIERPRIEVVSIFQPHRPQEAAPANACANGVQLLIPRIIVPVLRETDGIEKGHHGPGLGKQLLEFNIGDGVGFGAKLIAVVIQWRGFPFLVATDSAFAAGKKAFVERQLVWITPERERKAVGQTEMNESPAAQIDMIRTAEEEPLIVHIAAQAGDSFISV